MFSTMDNITKHDQWRLERWGVDVLDPKDPGSRRPGDNRPRLIRRGVLVDWIPRRGISVDFLVPQLPAQEIPFSCVIRPDPSAGIHVGQRVEALFQRSPNEPFYWRPAKLLVLLDDSDTGFAYVEFRFGGEVVREMVSSDHVRAVVRLGDQMAKGASAVESNRLYWHNVVFSPAWLDVTKEKDFLQCFEREFTATGAKLTGNCLEYIVRDKRKPYTENDMKPFLEDFEEEHEQTDMHRGRKRTLSGDEREDVPGDRQNSTGDKEMTFPWIWLPPELVQEVLSLLTVEQQVQSRRVCRMWNFFLSAPALLVRMDPRLPRRDMQFRLMATVVHKLVTPSIKCLVVPGSGWSFDHENGVLGTVVEMLTAKRIRVPVIAVQEGVATIPDGLRQVCARIKKANWRGRFVDH